MYQPVEVWLTKRNLAVRCMVVHEDERADLLDVRSLDMRGAQREVTSHFQHLHYEPAGRWRTEAVDAQGRPSETMRLFRQSNSVASD